MLHSVVRLSLEVLSLFKSTISLRLSTDSPFPPSPSTVGEMLAGHWKSPLPPLHFPLVSGVISWVMIRHSLLRHGHYSLARTTKVCPDIFWIYLYLLGLSKDSVRSGCVSFWFWSLSRNFKAVEKPDRTFMIKITDRRFSGKKEWKIMNSLRPSVKPGKILQFFLIGRWSEAQGYQLIWQPCNKKLAVWNKVWEF